MIFVLNEVIEILKIKSFGWGGVTVILGAIIPLFTKKSIITSITSSKVEKLLFSKEKRMYINITNFLLAYLVINFVTLLFAISFSKAGVTMAFFNTVSVITIVSLLIIMMIILVSDSYFSEHLTGFGFTLFSFSFFAIHMVCLFLVAPFLIAATLNSSLTQEQITMLFNHPIEYKNQISVVLIVLCVANLIFEILAYSTKTAFFQKFIYERFFIIDSDSIQWYIYHPMDKDHVLLGNNASLSGATIFKIKEKNDILTCNIHVLHKSNKTGKPKKEKKRGKKIELQTSHHRRRFVSSSSFSEANCRIRNPRRTVRLHR